ncbi:hypothetical protein [Methanocella conradii]|uniref:hypothetical protein n=1 Tax=Methanocella conradii TaxID=1175444 RepID=UPI0024B36D1B|nr:hypothetical protein [Methanocella conradii]MDI6896936.1 hypothetical protein [Methanocella conradii]
MKVDIKMMACATLLFILFILIVYMVNAWLAGHGSVYIPPAFIANKTSDASGTYLNIRCVDFGSAKEIKGLDVISGSTGEDSVPPSANETIKLNTIYRFKFDSSSKKIEAYAIVDGRNELVIDVDNANLSTSPI